MDAKPITVELDTLVRQTSQLWPAGWVSYNWRNYTYDHIQRVRCLAVRLAEREGGDCLECDLAALLHDVTKLYDGEYLTDAQGNRLVDSTGYWISATRYPLGANEVTRLYDRLHLAGQVHSRSGAAVAWHLLRKRGFSYGQRDRICEAISEHLGPSQGASPDALCLYDADLIDANIGLPAFVRHIYIHRHFYEIRHAPEQPAMRELLATSPREYLEPYIRQALPRWVESKQRDFPPLLRTAAGREVAAARLARLCALFTQLNLELDQEPTNSGMLAVLEYLLGCSEEPSIAEEITVLSNGWSKTRELTPPAARFIRALAEEAAGLQ